MIYKVTDSQLRKEKPWTRQSGVKGTMIYTVKRSTHCLIGIPVFTRDVILNSYFEDAKI